MIPVHDPYGSIPYMRDVHREGVRQRQPGGRDPWGNRGRHLFRQERGLPGRAAGMRWFTRGLPGKVEEAEEGRRFHRVRKERQVCIRALLQDIRHPLPIVLVMDLQCPGGLLPAEDERVEIVLSHVLFTGYQLAPAGG